MKPRAVGQQTTIDLTGALLPWDATKNAPCFLRLPESEYSYVPCFTTIEQLREMMGRVGITDYKVKKIDDGYEFMSSFNAPQAQDLRVILNPRYVESGRIRFTQVVPQAN